MRWCFGRNELVASLEHDDDSEHDAVARACNRAAGSVANAGCHDTRADCGADTAASSPDSDAVRDPAARRRRRRL